MSNTIEQIKQAVLAKEFDNIIASATARKAK